MVFASSFWRRISWDPLNLNKLHNRIPIRWLIVLTIVVLSVILVTGLKSKDFSRSNNAGWIADRPGIRFEKIGVAYTDSISGLIQEHISARREFSVEIALKPESFGDEGFCFIFLIHEGHDRSQLLIGQWRSSLIVMNGDDYDNRRKTKRISYTSTSTIPDTHLLSVTSGPEGSKIYLDGRLVKGRKDLRLEIPDDKNSRLLLGNSVYGNHPWSGDIYGVALYDSVLSESDIETHFQVFSKTRRFAFTKQPPPLMLFPLDEKRGKLAKNHPGGTRPLHLPSRMKVLSPRIFPRGRLEHLFDRRIFTNRDALLNFFGFVPLGVLLSATLIRLGGRNRRHSVMATLLAGFLISLFIETVQAWIPDRNSDIQDLILNTIGTLVGAASCKYFTRAQSDY